VVGLRSNTRLNACNLCHLDRTLAWTADRLHEWYGTDPPELTPDEQTVAASLLWLFKGDGGQRAIAASSMGWPPAREAFGGGWTVPHLAQLLLDPYAAVRFNALTSLAQVPEIGPVENNFDAGPEDRAAAREVLLEAWRSAAGRHPAQLRPELLYVGNEPDWKTVERLLQQRDDRPMVVVE
jgi:hypothetical protein